jgi:hypothetical protein
MLPIAKKDFPQSKTGSVKAQGPCSVANSGTVSKLIINCTVDPKQGKELTEILNQVLASRLDLAEVKGKLTEIAENSDKLLSFGSPTHGELLPGNEKTPSSGCNFPTDGFRIFIGGTVVWSQFLPIDALKVGPKDYVSFAPKGDGIGVSAVTTEPDGKIIVKVADNNFIANANNTLERTVSKDHTRLDVTNEYGDTVLSVRFLNPHSIMVLGRFSAKYHPVIIGDSQISTGSLSFGSQCLQGPKGLIIE